MRRSEGRFLQIAHMIPRNAYRSPRLHLLSLLFLFSLSTKMDALAISTSATFSVPFIITPPAIVFDTITECESRDFVLTVYNINSSPLTITKYMIGGASANEFSVRLPSTLPVLVRANDWVQITVRFTPKGGGTKSATFSVVDSSTGTQSNTITIRGHVEAAALIYSPIGLSFGPVNLGSSRTLRMYLSNTGLKNINVLRINIPGFDTTFQVLNNPAPFILKAGESFELLIRFTPSSAGSLRDFLQVNSTDCNGLVSVISLDGIGVIGTIAQVLLPPVVRGKPGSHIGIPIKLLNPIFDRPAKAFSFSLLFNPTTLLPLDVHFHNVKVPGYSAKWSLPAPGILRIDASGITPILDSGIIINLIMKVFIGDAESFPIRFDQFRFEDEIPFAVTHDGLFVLDSICQIPKQLIIQKNRPHFQASYPNPFNSAFSFRFYLPREMDVQISIINEYGEELYFHSARDLQKGNHLAHVNGDSFPMGVLHAILRTSAGSDVLRIVHLK